MLALSIIALFVVFVGGLVLIFGFGYPGYKATMRETHIDIKSAKKQKAAILKQNSEKEIQNFPQLKSEYSRLVNEIEVNRRERKNTKIGFAVTIAIYLVLLAVCSFWIYTGL
ncbi:MAG: hypothetical protein AAB946_02800 [Patescibacteria group bacterium]